MKTVKIALAVVGILAVLWVVFYEIAMGSDTDDAIYKTTIEITNTGTALTGASANISLSTPDMINAGTINSTADNCAMLTGAGGTDIPFMPGYDTNPWITFVDSISGNATLNHYLYSSGVTGGNIVYFPGDGGAEIADIELASFDFTLTWKGYLDTSAANVYLAYKGSCYYLRSTTGTITFDNGGFGSLTAAGLSFARETEITVNRTGNTEQLWIDGVLKDTDTIGTTANGGALLYICGDGGAGNEPTYMEYFELEISGVQTCYIDWEYGATFTDDSGNGNDATPVFRTTASDADLSADVISQEGLATATSPTAASADGWNMVTTTLAEPDNLFTQSATPTFGIGDIDYGELISDRADYAGQDPTNWQYIFAFSMAIAAAIFIFARTHSTRMGRRGSLLLSVVSAEVVLIVFYLWSSISGLALIPFAIIGMTMVIWKKSPAPVD